MMTLTACVLVQQVLLYKIIQKIPSVPNLSQTPCYYCSRGSTLRSLLGANIMEYQQNYCNSTNIFARQNSRRPVITQIQYYYRRMCCNLFVVVLAFSGLISTQVAQAVVLPRNIVSEVRYFELDDVSNLQTSTVPDFSDYRAFNNNPAPHVTDQNLSQMRGTLQGTSYADAQGQWGNSAHSRFIESGILTQSFYSAQFTKKTDQDVLTTKISNTSFSVRDFGSQAQGDLVAGFRFLVHLYPGNFDFPNEVPSPTPVFDKQVSIWGRAGTGYYLLGDYDFFTGVYTEDIYGTDANYDLNSVSLDIALDQFSVGQDFTVRWTAVSLAFAQGGETLADAQFWDPIGGTPGPFFSVGPGTSSPVPEPAVLWLFGSGLLGLVGMRSRKRKLNQDK